MPANPTAQNDPRARMLQGLLQPDAYPHPAADIRHLQTHISDVFLTGQFAYKLKKPLALGFLDFSTLEKRLRACEDELALNRRLAPELYLAVVPIGGTVDAPRVGADGEALDYAVQMREFEQRDLLEQIAARGELTAAHVDELADVVARFHSELPPAAAGSEYGTSSAVMAPALQNFEQMLPLVHDEKARQQLLRLRDWTLAQHDVLRDTFARRRAGGFVRECHGDLHLGNIVLVAGHVRVFDCIEFNPALRWIDVMNEIAFAAMDLLQRGYPGFASRLLDRYLQTTGDYAGLAVLRYYMVYRALVRAKVEMLRIGQLGEASDARAPLEAQRDRHLALAERLTQVPPLAIILMHGLSGSGKTAVSQALLERLGAVRIRSDVERKRMHGMAASTRSGSDLSGGIYSAQASSDTYERLADLAGRIVSSGFPVIVDAAFLQHAQRDRHRRLAQECLVPIIIVDVHANEAVLRARVAQRALAATDASEAGVDVLEMQLGSRDLLDRDERHLAVTFESEVESTAALAQTLQKRLAAIPATGAEAP